MPNRKSDSALVIAAAVFAASLSTIVPGRAQNWVTLVGLGGVGKTRLAIRVGAAPARAFPDGGWLVELAEVHDSELIGSAVMTALDLRDQAGTRPLPLLLSCLQDRQLLQVLDNCEHLLSAAAQIVTLIGAASGLRVIATSRQPLSVQGVGRSDVVPEPRPLPGRTGPRR